MRASKKQELKERILSKDLKFLLSFSRRREALQIELETTNDTQKRKNIESRIEFIVYISRFNSILDNIIEMSNLLKDKKLTKEEISYFTLRRENFRKELQKETKKELYRRIEHWVKRAEFKTTLKGRLKGQPSNKEMCVPTLWILLCFALLLLALFSLKLP